MKAKAKPKTTYTHPYLYQQWGGGVRRFATLAQAKRAAISDLESHKERAFIFDHASIEPIGRLIDEVNAITHESLPYDVFGVVDTTYESKFQATFDKEKS